VVVAIVVVVVVAMVVVVVLEAIGGPVVTWGAVATEGGADPFQQAEMARIPIIQAARRTPMTLTRLTVLAFG